LGRSETTLKLPDEPPHSELAREYPRAFSNEKGIEAQIEERPEAGYRISLDGGTCLIEHQTRSDLMRALGQWLTHAPADSSGEPKMDFRGLMIDSSRNAVMRPGHLRKVMLRLSLFGYNALCLYTEDTYEVEGHPEFGYLRGRFTREEIMALDSYAAGLGIEMFPCIQTLGHMEQILSHPNYSNLRDDRRILNLKVDDTYTFLEDLVDAATRPYSSDRIHLGLDETWGLSRGRAFAPNTPIDPRDDYLNHVSWLADLCRKRGLKPMMWGDIVIGMSGTEAFSEEQAETLPRDVKMVFWNYYRPDPEYYRETIRQYREMGFEPLVAPGLWSWGRLWASQQITDASAVHFMKVSREEGVRESLMTMWGDDGHEAPFASSYPALAQFADDCWLASPDRDDTKRMVSAICGTDFDAYVLPSLLDHYPGREDDHIQFRTNLSKGILWDDPLLGIFARHYEDTALKSHFLELAGRIDSASEEASDDDERLFRYARRLSGVMVQKADLHNEARDAYLKGDKEGLARISARIPALVGLVRGLMDAHTGIWLEERKPFGLEVLQARYGGQLVRLQRMKEVLDAFASGETGSIPQFDQETVRIWPSASRCHPSYGDVSTMSAIR